VARRRPAYDILQQQTFVQLQTLPGVGPATAADLIRLGVASLDDLSRRDPRELYEGISALDGVRREPRLLEDCAAAVHAARTGEALPWWGFLERERRGAR
jgi:predicted RecB family nuclease